MTLPIGIWFDQRDEASRLVALARGWPVFQAMAEHPKLVPLDARVFLPTDFTDSGARLPIPKHGVKTIIFADLPLLADNPELYDLVLASDCILIVDLHFPLPSPDHILAVQPGRGSGDIGRDEALDEQAREHWRDPDRLNRAWRILRDADVVTISREDWMPSSVDEWPHAVLLPDVEDGDLDTAVEFYRRWWEATAEILIVRKGLRRWSAFVAFRRLLRGFQRDLRQELGTMK